jgi:hypothetical protein
MNYCILSKHVSANTYTHVTDEEKQPFKVFIQLSFLLQQIKNNRIRMKILNNNTCLLTDSD